MDTLGDRVAAERTAKGWSQARLAEEVSRRGFKIGQSAIGNIEANRVKDTPKCIVQLAEALSVQPAWLQYRKGSKSSKPPAVSNAPITTAGRRLYAIRAALCPDLPAQIGVASEVAWEALTDRPGGLHPRIAQQVADVTGLPVEYVEDGDPSALTREQAVSLLVEAFREDEATHSKADLPKKAPSSSRPAQAASRKRS